jgi:hypothetical protein
MYRFMLAGLCIVASSLVSPATLAARQRETRTIYVTVFDSKGVPQTDLEAPEFEVRAGSRPLEILRAEPAQAAMRVGVIVSDAGTGGFQASIASFVQKLLGKAEFSLVTVITQPEVTMPYTSLGAELREGIRRVGPRGRLPGAGAQLMEAIQETIKGVRTDGKRPVILVLRVGNEGVTPLDGDQVRDQLRQSGAVMYVVSTLGATRAAAPSARAGISSEQAQLQDEEVRTSTLNLGQVLGDGSRESGGRHDQVVSTTLIPSLERVADELLSQYARTFVIPDRFRPNDKISVSTKRKGAKVQAPVRLPTK